MTPAALWRAVAIVAALGWAGTALGWIVSAAAPDRPPADDVREARRADPIRGRGSEHRTERGQQLARSGAPSNRVPPDLAELRDEVRGEVLEQIEQERAERRQQRSDERLDRHMDEVAQFAQQNGLDEATQAALEASVTSLHERLEELRPAGPPGPGGPPAGVMDAIEGSFDQFRDEVAEALGDPELADAFTDSMTPRPLRDRDRIRE